MSLKLAENTANFDWLKTNVDSCQMFQFFYWEATLISLIYIYVAIVQIDIW